MEDRYENQNVKIEFPWRVPGKIIAYHYSLLLKEGVKKRPTHSNLCQNAQVEEQGARKNLPVSV